MRAEMTERRIGNWACPYCGSRIKKKVILRDQIGKEVGYSLVCCNCGHVENFAANESGVSVFVAGDNHMIKKISMGCAKGEFVECEFKEKCPYNPDKIAPSEPPKTEKPPQQPPAFDSLSKIYD